MRCCTPSSSHSWSRRPSRARLCPSGPVSWTPWCVRRRWYDEGTYQPRAVVVWYGTLRQLRSIKWSLPYRMHWTFSLPYTANWTTATLFLLVSRTYQLATFNVCSPFLTQPYVWSPAHRDVITWPLCCAIATGFLLSSASNTGCVRLFIVVCKTVRRRTWSTSSIKPSAAASARAGLRSAESMTVAVPRTLSSLGDCTFATAGPRAHVRHTSVWCMQSTDTFRRHLKIFLFHQAFLSWHC